MKERLLKYFAQWNEFITLPLALFVWVISPTLIRWADPTAAVFDGGIFQAILFGLIKFMVASGFSWLFLKLSFPSLYRILDEFHDELLKSTAIENYHNKKLCLLHALTLYCLYLFALLFAMHIL